MKGISSMCILAIGANLGAALMLSGGVFDTSIFLPYALGFFEDPSSYWYVCLTIGAIVPVLRIFLSFTFIINAPVYH